MHNDCGDFANVGEGANPLVDEEPERSRVCAVESDPERSRVKESTTASLSHACSVCLCECACFFMCKVIRDIMVT